MTMKSLLFLIRNSLLMAILFGWSNGSEPEVIALSKKVGFLIDAEENIHYGIIQGVKGLESVQFYEIKKNKYMARIVFVEFSNLQSSKRYYSLQEFTTMQTHVNLQKMITENDRLGIRENLTFLRTKETVQNIPSGQFVTLMHRNGSKIQGTLTSFENNQLEIQTPISIEIIPMWNMKQITYREEIKDRNSWKPIVYSLSALAGILLSEGWNVQTRPDIDFAWYNRFLGATFGLLAGSESFQIFSVLTSPKTVFKLTPDDMDKLKN
ncbi:MAG: hypothetical protein HOF04_02580 [Candidatus Marinimicrobia bacterium]|jgi:hypothetical protein|nr:hypothetical protein [Candidatus Neomarinimicrobiota bacterium]MBT3828227.1 hypothetical protein [Candidatus Neomarinimicrobiota bacterium]MBT3997144.1 hypothetical protein [Candidatus Neomarinimicrobiota bacterium]MBT6368733.1 hypothetical protein [Candidatus Neomarinimicrobiota bacterium]MBT7871132.1 hypothetical protein [Candidatus Neomarinimicrobiota bacterium]